MGQDCTINDVASLIALSPSQPYTLNLSGGESIIIQKGWILIDSQTKADFFFQNPLPDLMQRKIVLQNNIKVASCNKDLLITTDEPQKTMDRVTSYEEETLDFFCCKILSISGPFALTFADITSLYLEGHQLTDLLFLSGATKITTLHLYGNMIQDVSPLSSLTELKELNLEKNLIKDVTPLFSLVNLETLALDENPLDEEKVNTIRHKLPNCDITFQYMPLLQL